MCPVMSLRFLGKSNHYCTVFLLLYWLLLLLLFPLVLSFFFIVVAVANCFCFFLLFFRCRFCWCSCYFCCWYKGTWPRFSPSFNKASRNRYVSAGVWTSDFQLRRRAPYQRAIWTAYLLIAFRVFYIRVLFRPVRNLSIGYCDKTWHHWTFMSQNVTVTKRSCTQRSSHKT